MKKIELSNHSISTLQAGIGLRPPHYKAILETHPAIDWLEVHSENYFSPHSLSWHYLEQICVYYPLSLHGVGLSLGSADPINKKHLNKLKILVDHFSPIFVSEHLCWSSVDGYFLNDLLPLPYTEEALNVLTEKIQLTQDYLKRQILLENISSYLTFNCSLIPESEFLTELARRTGCGLLLDINNLYVSSVNHGWSALDYLNTVPVQYVKEMHLAGFTTKELNNGFILIDTHDQPVSNQVWALYREAINYFGSIPTLIEWDKNINSLDVLVNEAEKANQILRQANAKAKRFAEAI